MENLKKAKRKNPRVNYLTIIKYCLLIVVVGWLVLKIVEDIPGSSESQLESSNMDSASSFMDGWLKNLGFKESELAPVNEDIAPDLRQSASPYDAITTLAATKGSGQCVEKVKGLADFIGANNQETSSVVYFGEETQDLLSAAIVTRDSSGMHMAIMDVAQGDSCTGTYEIVKVWLESCPEVVTSVYANYTLKSEFIPSVLNLYEAAAELHLFAMTLPNEQGCLTLQKEII